MVYAINEGLFKKKHKLYFNSEQKKECKDIEAQIKKIGPSIVNKYNKDKDLLHKLQNAVRRDLLPYESGQPDVTDGINYKFEFKIDSSASKNDGNIDRICINILGDINDAIDRYTREINPDLECDTIGSVVNKIYREVGKEIVSSIKADTVKVSYDYDNLYDELQIVITPKAQSTEAEESALIMSIKEECESIEEYVKSMDIESLDEIDIEYLTEGLGSVVNKIKTTVEIKKKKLKDKVNKMKKEWERKDELSSYNSMSKGHYFTDLNVTIDDYIDLPSDDKAFDGASYVLDDLTYIFETAWKKIMSARNENSSYKDYGAALKDLKKIEDTVEKEYDKFDIKGKLETVFGLDSKKESHTLTNKDISNLMEYYNDVKRWNENMEDAICRVENTIGDEITDLLDLADEYEKQLKDADNKNPEEKNRIQYMVSSLDTLSRIECSTNDAMDKFLDTFENCVKKYRNLISSYLNKVDIDMKKKK